MAAARLLSGLGPAALVRGGVGIGRGSRLRSLGKRLRGRHIVRGGLTGPQLGEQGFPARLGPLAGIGLIPLLGAPAFHAVSLAPRLTGLSTRGRRRRVPRSKRLRLPAGLPCRRQPVR